MSSLSFQFYFLSIIQHTEEMEDLKSQYEKKLEEKEKLCQLQKVKSDLKARLYIIINV